jgi:hypothetical protein
LYIALYLLLDSTSGRAIEDWFLLLWLCKTNNSLNVAQLILPSQIKSSSVPCLVPC